jgi:hypothetical protein
MKHSLRRLAVGTAAVAAIAASVIFVAQGLHAQSSHHDDMMPIMQHHGATRTGRVPTMAGQDAFGTIQEIVKILDADPETDWSKVNLETLRQHLIDMNEVTLDANAAAKPVEGGIEVAVTGTGRTVAAIQRMVTAHAGEIEETHLNGWSAKTAPLDNGVLLTVSASEPKEVQHIRGLGFIGIMVSGQHHQPHHLAMARGTFVH